MNRLAGQNSPYLLQHADNPVEWYPWGEEAFTRARKENKPIFLSIGYSACHWCHVMEKESFRNERIAGILNEHFISIKVDREERPDIDALYLDALRLMGISGGWPLSVFITPDAKPFYGGTYFPPRRKYGRPGFEELLQTISGSWKDKQGDVTRFAQQISNRIVPLEADRQVDAPLEALKDILPSYQESFDRQFGGFGRAPKFPQPGNLTLLLYYWYSAGDQQALSMVESTLDAMAAGGIYDHLGGGFHRYATDDRWLVPHFEKMLYDQALISQVYIQAFQITDNPDYARVARETLDYVLREMTAPGGGFYSAEDADSEGKEGIFYLWDAEQIDQLLDGREAAIFREYYNVTKAGNYENQKTILNITGTIADLADRHRLDPARVNDILSRCRLRLREQRSSRIRPFRDEKIITAWNGLMISALAQGGAALAESRYTLAAERAARFALTRLRENNRLLRFSYRGKAGGKGFLDDYSFLIMGLLDLYQADFDASWLIEARRLAEDMLALFADRERGGFFLDGSDHDRLLARTKPGYDGALPSGNAVAALALYKLHGMTRDRRFREAADGVIGYFSGSIKRSVLSCNALLTALIYGAEPGSEIIIAGEIEREETREMLGILQSRFLPLSSVLLHESEAAGKILENELPFLKNLSSPDGKAKAYICSDFSCQRPVDDAAEFGRLVAEVAKPRLRGGLRSPH
ncbi:MAG: thioredoxin domain-containing protein [Candidatus Krumholzibacteriota bacterium]|nr:thioredoxin domain-containing protein [Candidatus Krumholzibacteriota bacterium]